MLELLQHPMINRLVVTLILLIVLLFLRHLITRWVIVRGAHILDEQQRRQLFWLRTAIMLVFLLGLLGIWGGALQTMLLSLTAVMLALVIATEELLMCLSGFLLRATGRLFGVGDWIEFNGIRGEVTDHTLLSTAPSRPWRWTPMSTACSSSVCSCSARAPVPPRSSGMSRPVSSTPPRPASSGRRRPSPAVQAVTPRARRSDAATEIARPPISAATRGEPQGGLDGAGAGRAARPTYRSGG
jgi:hypothetical protein